LHGTFGVEEPAVQLRGQFGEPAVEFFLERDPHSDRGREFVAGFAAGVNEPAFHLRCEVSPRVLGGGETAVDFSVDGGEAAVEFFLEEAGAEPAGLFVGSVEFTSHRVSPRNTHLVELNGHGLTSRRQGG